MKLEVASTDDIVSSVDRALLDLTREARMPAIYVAGDWLVKLTTFEDRATMKLPAPERMKSILHACLTAYATDTGHARYQRVFKNDVGCLWVCECILNINERRKAE